MKQTKETGGYFQLELPERTEIMHSQAIWLNSGRNALEYILRSLPDIHTLWIPYFTCDAVYVPLERLKINIKRYHINESLELPCWPHLGEGEYLLATNYYGIKDAYMLQLFEHYGEKLIIDNAQAWYAPCPEGAKALYSPRKFAGLPDGGIACGAGTELKDRLEQDCSYERCLHLLKRIDCGASAAYTDFQTNDSLLYSLPLRQMSRLTAAMLRSIDFTNIQQKRRENFAYLHAALRDSNLLAIPEPDSFACPLIYPFRTENSSLKAKLVNHKIYVATYWPNVLKEQSAAAIEHQLASNIIAVPIDQRYGIMDMQPIINTIQS